MSLAVEAPPRLSWSQINTYTQCPAKWWSSPHFPMEHVPSALKFGRAVHHALAAFYAALPEGCHLEADELLSVYETAWSEPEEAVVRFGKNEDEGVLRQMAARMFGAFLETVQPGEVLAVEESFAVEISGVLVSGIVDLVEVKDGKFWVVDNKTSKNEPSSAFDGEQLLLYRLGLEQLGLIPEDAEVGLRFDVLRKLKTRGEFVTVEVEATAETLQAVEDKVAQVAKAIEAGVVYRNRSWACAGCPWSRTCAEVDLGGV